MKAFKLGLKLYHVQVFLILLSALVLCSFLGGNCGPEGMEGGEGSVGSVGSVGSEDTNNLLQDPRVPSESSRPSVGGGQVKYSTIKTKDVLGDRARKAQLNGPSPQPTQSLPPAGQSFGKPSTSMAAVPKSSIPLGSEELYVLRSEVASLMNKPAQTPCPPCGRCPEPSFSCKKVPNYNDVHSENNYLPKPVLSDFSTFAM
jgi:hypothetical protein